ncbi:hypothetical protein [Bacillus sp. 1NLA3E]|jgi:hypothetical protein|uniref:hypothetical protein n=1 Tax=Bacillus sp. 1NLA3E TaxID=666686 RepID=UPI000247EE46|nr:hypothetical protein [Bacillus sp. 1NLA3E]
MKLLQERFYVFISVLFTVLVFAFLISNFPVEENNSPEQSPVADARIQPEKK